MPSLSVGAGKPPNGDRPVPDRLEGLLARLLTDRAFRTRFVRDPLAVAAQEGLSPEECRAAAKMPVQDLQTAARSFEYKRDAKRRRGARSWIGTWFGRG
jgi:hypothetical protein